MADDAAKRSYYWLWWIGCLMGLVVLAVLWLAFLGWADNASVLPTNSTGVSMLRSIVAAEVTAIAVLVGFALYRRRWRSLPRRVIPWAVWVLVIANFGFLVASHVY